ncbi:MAG: hypothetical protein F4Z45_07450 [Gammaproteobacteria bacterium]|nr:hypothetical protein [Gammaproteobacteria bacterium]
MNLEPVDLMRLGRDVEVPFSIALDGEPCRVHRIFRLLPGRRLTALGHWRGRDLVVKLFMGAGAARYCARERRGVERLAASGTPTPELLGDALAAPDGRALLFDYLPDARPLAAGEAEGAMNAVRLLAGLHGHGFTHGDPHLANFIRSGGKLWVVDGDGVGRLWRQGEVAELRALAEFLAQHPPTLDARLEKLLAGYADSRNWAADADRMRRAKRLVATARRRRVRRYLAKTERPCTEFHTASNWRWRCLVKQAWRSDAVLLAEAFARDPEGGLKNAEVIKDGNSATVFRLKLGGLPVVVKRYNIKSLSHRIRRWFKRRALTAWRNGHRLALLAIPTAEPLALVERRWGPLTGRCYLVMADKGDLDLAAEAGTQGWLPGRLDQVTALLAQLKAAELGHGDTKASNFLVHDGRVHLIDLDALSPRRDPAADVTRFLDNFDGTLRAQAEAQFAAAGLI